jgi:hypothetical protein
MPLLDHFQSIARTDSVAYNRSIFAGEQVMTAENFDRVLQGLRQHTPFHVFTVELTSGRRFEVDHPGALVVRDGVAVFIAPGGIPIWFDRESVSQIIGASANELA